MKHAIIALIAGSVMPLAFAPFGYFPIAILGPAVLLYLWMREDSSPALLGFLFGLGMFGVGVSWVFISIHEFGSTSTLFATIKKSPRETAHLACRSPESCW